MDIRKILCAAIVLPIAAISLPVRAEALRFATGTVTIKSRISAAAKRASCNGDSVQILWVPVGYSNGMIQSIGRDLLPTPIHIGTKLRPLALKALQIRSSDKVFGKRFYLYFGRSQDAALGKWLAGFPGAQTNNDADGTSATARSNEGGQGTWERSASVRSGNYQITLRGRLYRSLPYFSSEEDPAVRKEFMEWASPASPVYGSHHFEVLFVMIRPANIALPISAAEW